MPEIIPCSPLLKASLGAPRAARRIVRAASGNRSAAVQSTVPQNAAALPTDAPPPIPKPRPRIHHAPVAKPNPVQAGCERHTDMLGATQTPAQTPAPPGRGGRHDHSPGDDDTVLHANTHAHSGADTATDITSQSITGIGAATVSAGAGVLGAGLLAGSGVFSGARGGTTGRPGGPTTRTGGDTGGGDGGGTTFVVPTQAVTDVPEPASVLMMGIALASLVVLRRVGMVK